MTKARHQPAARVIAAFHEPNTSRGGGKRLSALLTAAGHKCAQSTVSCWALPEASGGRGGRIPQRWHAAILEVARAEGIDLTEYDLHGLLRPASPGEFCSNLPPGDAPSGFVHIPEEESAC